MLSVGLPTATLQRLTTGVFEAILADRSVLGRIHCVGTARLCACRVALDQLAGYKIGLFLAQRSSRRGVQ